MLSFQKPFTFTKNIIENTVQQRDSVTDYDTNLVYKLKILLKV